MIIPMTDNRCPYYDEHAYPFFALISDALTTSASPYALSLSGIEMGRKIKKFNPDEKRVATPTVSRSELVKTPKSEQFCNSFQINAGTH